MAMASWNLSLSPRPKLVQVSCRKREKNRDNYDPYKVIEITPPPKNLGVRCFPSEWHIRLFRWIGVGDDFGKCPEEEALYSFWRRLNPNASHFTHLCAVEKGKTVLRL